MSILSLPDSLTAKLGQYKVLEANKSVIPVSILPDHALLMPTTSSVLVNTMVSSNPSAVDFSISAEVTDTDWSAHGTTKVLYSYLDAAGLNGFSVIQLDSDGKIYFNTYDAGVMTSSISYDITAHAAGVLQCGISRAVGVAQKLYIDKVLVASGTDATDSMGTPTPVVATISTISKANPLKIHCTGAHNIPNGSVVKITGIVGTMDLHGVDTLNGNSYIATVTAADDFTIPVAGGLFDDRVSGGTVTWNPPQTLAQKTGTTNLVITPGVMNANDMALLYEIVRNNLVVVTPAGTLQEVSKS